MGADIALGNVSALVYLWALATARRLLRNPRRVCADRAHHWRPVDAGQQALRMALKPANNTYAVKANLQHMRPKLFQHGRFITHGPVGLSRIAERVIV